jgi:hypothetical protein
LNLVDSCSRYQVFISIPNRSATACIAAIEQLGSIYMTSPNSTSTPAVNLSRRNCNFGSPIGTDQMNGKAESNWKYTRQIAYKLLTHARLNLAFVDMAIRYAWQIKAVLPLPSLIDDSANNLHPGTPFECYFAKRPNIGRYKVFGCPCAVKVYTRKNIDSDANAATLNSKNLVQRGVRGIFISFPINQAGYLVWTPTSGHILASADVLFDKDFTSPLQYPDHIFHDAQPTRNPLHRLPTPDSTTDHTQLCVVRLPYAQCPQRCRF